MSFFFWVIQKSGKNALWETAFTLFCVCARAYAHVCTCLHVLLSRVPLKLEGIRSCWRWSHKRTGTAWCGYWELNWGPCKSSAALHLWALSPALSVAFVRYSVVSPLSGTPFFLLMHKAKTHCFWKPHQRFLRKGLHVVPRANDSPWEALLREPCVHQNEGIILGALSQARLVDLHTST